MSVVTSAPSLGLEVALTRPGIYEARFNGELLGIYHSATEASIAAITFSEWRESGRQAPILRKPILTDPAISTVEMPRRSFRSL